MEIGAPILQEKLPLQASLIRHVDYESERKIEIHDIDSDLEEETRNPTYPVNIVTLRTSSMPISQFSGDIFYPLFSKSSFSHVDLNPIVKETCEDPLVSTELASDTAPPSPCVLLTLHTSEPPTTSFRIPFSQVENPSQATIPSAETKSSIPPSSTSLISIFSPLALDISPLNVEIPVSQSELNVEIPMSQSQPQSTSSSEKEVVSSTEEIIDFEEDAVVSLWNYCWSKKQKAILKKGLKRTREGILKHVPTLDKIVWKTDVPNEK